MAAANRQSKSDQRQVQACDPASDHHFENRGQEPPDQAGFCFHGPFLTRNQPGVLIDKTFMALQKSMPRPFAGLIPQRGLAISGIERAAGIMNVHHLELFYFVAKHGGIMPAVRNIPYGIQQPAVSAQVAQLEEFLGVTLFQRRPFALTPAGEKLFQFIAPFFFQSRQHGGGIAGRTG